MPKKERNPNRIRRQPTPDSPPPGDQGARQSPVDDPDWIEVGHREADSDAVSTTHGMGAGGGKPKKPRA